MKKLISNPFECGYCDIQSNYRDDKCKHPKSKSITICKGDKFPKNCPLETLKEEKYISLRELEPIFKKFKK